MALADAVGLVGGLSAMDSGDPDSPSAEDEEDANGDGETLPGQNRRGHNGPTTAPPGPTEGTAKAIEDNKRMLSMIESALESSEDEDGA
eukprot:scaffold668792_cov45-Prasinocladus_malaysianus.AAC.1